MKIANYNDHDFSNYNRLNRILKTALKYGFGELVELLIVQKQVHLPKMIEERFTREPMGVRLRLMLMELGPTFIKFGQMLSMRRDLFPLDIIAELEKLQDRVKPVEYAEIRKELENEFKIPIGAIFKRIDTEPIATASIGQVYKAVLKDGKKVAIKVQKPHVEKVIEADISVLAQLARLAEQHIKESQYYQPSVLVKEFARTIRSELDYRREARNLERFKRDFKNDKTVYIPELYWKYTTKKVIVEEFIEGKKITAIKSMPESEKKKIAETSANFFIRQILVNGFYNADPHPGNLFLMKNNVIGAVDYGMVGAIDFELKEVLQEIFISLLEKNLDGFMDSFERVLVFSEDTNKSEFRQDFLELAQEYYGLSLEEIDIVELIGAVVKICQTHKVHVDPRLLLLFKMLATIESFEREIYPQFRTVEISKPVIKEVMLQKLKPKTILETLGRHANAYSRLLSKIPERISKILDQTGEGKLKIEFEHVGLDNVVFKLDRTINKVSMSLIVSALIIGSSLMIFSNNGPTIYNLSAIGLIGMAIALFLGIILVLSILQTREV